MRGEGSGAAGDKRRFGETFIGGSALMNMQSDGMSVTSSDRVILLTHYVMG